MDDCDNAAHEFLQPLEDQRRVKPIGIKRAMAEDGIVQDFEAQVYRADRSIIWITENARCVRGGEGRILYYEGTVEDITQRKAAEVEPSTS